jgi:hypothetical protein
VIGQCCEFVENQRSLLRSKAQLPLSGQAEIEDRAHHSFGRMRFRWEQQVPELVCDHVPKHDAAVEVISPREPFHAVIQRRRIPGA